jgi:hypothetical protein
LVRAQLKPHEIKVNIAPDDITGKMLPSNLEMSGVSTITHKNTCPALSEILANRKSSSEVKTDFLGRKVASVIGMKLT